LWENATDDVKGIHEAMAQATDSACADALETGTLGAVEALRGMAGSHRVDQMRKKIFADTVDAVKTNEVWSMPFRVGDYSFGLKPSLVVEGSADATITQTVGNMFDYDEIITPNDKAAQVPHRACKPACWGICRGDPLFKHCNVGTYNAYLFLTSTWKYSRADFPLLIRLSVGHVSRNMLLGDTYGAGEALLLLGLIYDGDHLVPQLLQHKGKQLADCHSSQIAFRRLIRHNPGAAPSEFQLSVVDFSLQFSMAGGSACEPVQ
jgi:hypothetical protein